MNLKSKLLLFTLVNAAGFSSQVAAHGSMESPVSRVYNCYQEGPESPDSAACQAAQAVAGPQAFYDWNGIAQLAGGNDQAFVPDGRLCSGGLDKFAGLDLARGDWPKTAVEAGASQEFVFLATAPHSSRRFDFYITKDGYDPTQALTWDDLEPAPFCSYGKAPLNNGRYTMTCDLPIGKQGSHVIYNIWERDDSAETFYTCMDVTFDGDGTVDDDPDDGDSGTVFDAPYVSQVSIEDAGVAFNGELNTMYSVSVGARLTLSFSGDNAADNWQLYRNEMPIDSGQGNGATVNVEATEPGHYEYTVAVCKGSLCGEPSEPAILHVTHGGDDSGGDDSGGDHDHPGDSHCPAWDSATVYWGGDVVSHNGEQWRAGWWTRGAEPGTTGEWGVWRSAADEQCEGGDTTDPDDGGHDDDGSHDDDSDDSGDDTGSDDGSTDDGSTDDGSTDDGSTDTGGDNGDSTQSCPAWDAGVIYTSGDEVSHNGKQWRAGWWTQNNEPGTTGRWGVWREASDTECEGANGDDGSTGGGSDQDDSDNNDSGNGDSDNGDSDNGESATHDKVVGTYFVEWGVYGRDYHVSDIPAEQLTHILYGFIPICGPNESLRNANPQGYSALVSQCAGKQDYEVTVHDKFAALEKSYPGDRWDDPIRGNFGQLIKLKQQHPDVVILPSIGGWTLSDPFYPLANDPTKRAIFVNSVKEFLQTYTFFDGVDIDWEYPGGKGANPNLGSAADFQAYADLMRDLRAMLDELEAETGEDYELTSAVGAGPVKIQNANYAEAEQYMDYIFAMTYDYYGAWSSTLGHQTALYESANNNTKTGFNTADSIQNLIYAGVPSEKLVVGVAMYGRGWNNVSGTVAGQPFTGRGGGAIPGTWEAGVLDYKDIVDNYLGGTQGSGINGFNYGYDSQAEAPYLYNSNTGSLITYDNPRSVKAKGDYVKANELGGLFSWEIDGDNGDILNAMEDSLQ